MSNVTKKTSSVSATGRTSVTTACLTDQRFTLDSQEGPASALTPAVLHQNGRFYQSIRGLGYRKKRRGACLNRFMAPVHGRGDPKTVICDGRKCLTYLGRRLLLFPASRS